MYRCCGVLPKTIVHLGSERVQQRFICLPRINGIPKLPQEDARVLRLEKLQAIYTKCSLYVANICVDERRLWRGRKVKVYLKGKYGNLMNNSAR